jgi:hypothetical protein
MDELNIELDDETAAWLEARAAEQRLSLSEFIAELLREERESGRVEPKRS